LDWSEGSNPTEIVHFSRSIFETILKCLIGYPSIMYCRANTQPETSDCAWLVAGLSKGDFARLHWNWLEIVAVVGCHCYRCPCHLLHSSAVSVHLLSSSVVGGL